LSTNRRSRISSNTALSTYADEPNLAAIPEVGGQGGGMSVPQLLSILSAYWKQIILIAVGIIGILSGGLGLIFRRSS